MMHATIKTLLFVLLVVDPLTVPAWAFTRAAATRGGRQATTLSSLFASNNDDDSSNPSFDSNDGDENASKEAKQDLKRRMTVVRSLQSSFYGSSSEGEDEHPHLERETGRLLTLPLWRVPWWEVPGRSNVLNVHEPIYTNMFEAILRGPKPWCFGHLYLEGGSRNLNSDKDKYQLSSWKSTTTPSTGHKDQRSAVIGCLMNISDYRRMADGRLLLLVHAMERFVVTDVIQKLPYGIVNAQVLPDLEEMMNDQPSINLSSLPKVGSGDELKEHYLRYPRALAVQESIRFHDYEYDRNHQLPCPSNKELESSQILGSDLAKVIPYAPFSKTLAPPQESANSPSGRRATGLRSVGSDDGSAAASSRGSKGEDACSFSDDDDSCLEYRLLSEGILQIPGIDSRHPTVSNSSFADGNDPSDQAQQKQRYGLSTEELEYDLWLAINNFLIKTRTPVSPVLLGLLPTFEEYADDDNVEDDDETSVTIWPKGFVLKQIVKELNELDSVDHDFVLVPKEYPAYRRQRRLAYSAAKLLESYDTSKSANEVRPRLLAAPSTHDRLRLVLEGFDHWQQEQWGAFE